MMCDYIGYDFGAHYPDSICIDGYLWDMDSGHKDESGQYDWIYTYGGDIPCPKCNMLLHNQNVIDSTESDLEIAEWEED